MERFTYLSAGNLDYIEELYRKYKSASLVPGDVHSEVEESWKNFFDGFDLGLESATEKESLGHAEKAVSSVQATTVASGQGALQTAIPGTSVGSSAGTSGLMDVSRIQAELSVLSLLKAYRERGHLAAKTNPLDGKQPEMAGLETAESELKHFDPKQFGLNAQQLDGQYLASSLLGFPSMPLSALIEHLRKTYCASIGVELEGVSDSETKWIRTKFENIQDELSVHRRFDPATKKFIHDRLVAADGFERFLHTRYVAQKRFSLEGGDAVLPAIESVLEVASNAGLKEAVIGMAHRGRLNLLANLMGKDVSKIFIEFDPNPTLDPKMMDGDVKYHKGYSHDHHLRNGKEVHLSLAFNPSHLEFVNPVVLGMVRAKQDSIEAMNRIEKNRAPADFTSKKAVMPIVIHGDAAVAGQGVNYEALNAAGLKAYSVGGSLHIVINNQVGFTTFPYDSRTARYCTDLAKVIGAPVFHVNGDDAEAVVKVAEIAAMYRQEFGKDVFIDLVCYRRHGHNEGDEPAFTQPLMYKDIKTHLTPREIYAKRLQNEGVLSEAEAQKAWDDQMAVLTAAQTKAKANPVYPMIPGFEGPWKGFHIGTESEMLKKCDTTLLPDTLRILATQINEIPEGFNLHSKLGRFFESRKKAVNDGIGIDWGNGEALAFASLLIEGVPVRITGQDAERGTFTHRHSVLTDTESGKKHCLFDEIDEKQARFSVFNSHLSETAVLAYEYGYASTNPNALVIWEAQFGDFANGAQVIIDQFIASCETKWNRSNGVVLLLPHGYEGQGPEHSSARLERFLQMCGKANMQVCNLTTPSQIFHALRRQVKRDFRKPLVIMSPKSLLRHPQAVSKIDDFSKGTFEEVLDDVSMVTSSQAQAAKRLLLCSGKVYYDLVQEREARGLKEQVAIVRIEQLYPWPADKILNVLEKYSEVDSIQWVQEEPRNMGPYTYVFSVWNGGLTDFSSLLEKKSMGHKLGYSGRVQSASPAAGSPKVHDIELKALLESAFSGLKS